MNEAATKASVDQHKYRVGIGGFRQLYQYALENGVSEDDCLNGTGLDRKAVDNPGTIIDPSLELALIAKVCKILGQDFQLGVDVGLRQHLSSLGVLGLGLLSAENGYQAGEWGTRFAPVAFPLLKYSVQAMGQQPTITISDDHVPPETRQFLYARDLATIHNVHCDLLPGQPVGVKRIELTLARQPGMERLEALFGCEIECDQQTSVISLDHTSLKKAFPQANPFTLSQCEHHCEEILNRRRKPLELADQFKDLLRQPGHLTLNFTEASAILNLSARHARRKLQEQGSSWRRIREEVLIETAKALLTDHRSVQQVAEELGYTETSSFSHAFKRITGISPGHFVESHS